MSRRTHPPRFVDDAGLGIRELKQRRRRRQRRNLLKNEFTFYQQNSQLSRFAQHANGSKNVLNLNRQ